MRNRQLKDSTLFNFIGWVGIAIMLIIGSCCKVQAQEVVFVHFKRQADKIVYITNKTYEADKLVYITKKPWEVKENVWLIKGSRIIESMFYPGAVKIYTTKHKWEADEIIYFVSYKWQIPK